MIADANIEVLEPNTARLEDPLQYWERQKYVYPEPMYMCVYLYKLAVAFLCTPASSVPCEQLSVTPMRTLTNMICGFLLGSKLWHRLDTSLMEARWSQNVTADATVEVQQYLSESNIGRLEKPLEFWERQNDSTQIYTNLHLRFCAHQHLLCLVKGSSPRPEKLFKKNPKNI
ncbi:hypothetical protein NQD34_016834 [Periophthalmus magnuspinnatus]|nr:hypothetical protein NQD34_016834 [Periophthalmus magnuspinnatus]